MTKRGKDMIRFVCNLMVAFVVTGAGFLPTTQPAAMAVCIVLGVLNLVMAIGNAEVAINFFRHAFAFFKEADVHP